MQFSGNFLDVLSTRACGLTVAVNSPAAQRILLSELKAFDEFVDDGGDALLCERGKGGSGLGVRILEDDP